VAERGTPRNLGAHSLLVGLQRVHPIQADGKIAIDWVGASVYFLFNPYTKRWSEEVCNAIGIPVEKYHQHIHARR